MISAEELDRAILEHESKDTTYANCERLAWLYIVRDHIGGKSGKALPAVSGESAFLQAAASADPALVWDILDELMGTLAVLQPRMYQAVLRRLAGEE